MTKSFQEKIYTALTSIFFASIYLMATDYNNKTGLMTLFVIIVPIITALFKIYCNNYKFNIIIEPLHWYMLIFASFCSLSAIWAIDNSYSVSMGTKIVKILIYLSVFGMAFQNSNSVTHY